MSFYLPIILTIAANICYHLFLKLTPAAANPMLSLSVAYATAMAASLAIYPFFADGGSLRQAFATLNWTSCALGIAIVGLEVGFLLAYRLGWQISLAGMISSSAVSLLLIPIGLLFFKETVSTVNVIGIIFCLLGLILVNWKS